MTKITEHFSVEEFEKSDTAAKLGIDNQIKDPEILSNIHYLCKFLIEPLRSSISEPFIISSGYRCAKLNKAVGGAENSQHEKGEAADIVVKSGPKKLLQELELSGLDFDQAILYPNFLHLSLKKDGNRKQIIKK